MRRSNTWALVALLLAVAAPAFADKCKLGDSFEDCWARYNPDSATPAAAQLLETAATAEGDDVEKILKGLETGLDGGAPALATTTHNLLPFLAASGLVSDSDGNADDKLFTLDLNTLIPQLAEDNNVQLKAVLNTAPVMFGDLKKAFDTATGDTDRSAALDQELSASDDYTVSFTYSHINDRFGRSFEQYRERFSNLFEAAITAGTNEDAEADRLLRAVPKLMQQLNITDGSAKITDVAVLNALEASALAESRLEARVRATMAGNHLERFAELVNNQPQLLFSAELHKRDALVGADETAIKITYEFGLANLSDFNSKSHGACNLLDHRGNEFSRDTALECLGSFSAYIEKNEQRLKNADRFSLELSYVKVDAYDFESPADGVALARAGTRHIDLAMGYGRTLQTLGADRDSRLDFVAKYEDYSDDPDNKDRLVATLTFTTKLAGMSIPFSLVYANHEKFLPESDDQLSAHLGIKYQFDPKE